jgi:hypothetical protein
MEEASEDGKESPNSAHASGMNEVVLVFNKNPTTKMYLTILGKFQELYS